MDYSREKIEALLEQFGSPLSVFDENNFIKNYEELNTAMHAHYGKYQISYSFKTNYTPYICKKTKELGAYAEVVSGMEYSLAKKIGYEDRQIIFNGPDKGTEGREAFLAGAILNNDSLDELESFCKVAEMNPHKHFHVGLRANLDVGQGFISRFGMDEEDLEKAFRRAAKTDNLRISGLHCHISRCRGLEAWRRRTEYLLKLADKYFEGIPEYLDLGSGMFGSMDPKLASQFDYIPTYQEYAEVTAGIVADHYKGKEGPILFTEPGTTLINRFVDCISKVESIKTIHGHDFAVLNASIHNLGEAGMLKRLPVKVISGGAPQKWYDRIDLTGYTCLEQDVLLPGYQGKLAEGDYVVFNNTGGYSNVLKPPFIRPDCAMIVEDSKGNHTLIKEVETYEDIFRNYIL